MVTRECIGDTVVSLPVYVAEVEECPLGLRLLRKAGACLDFGRLRMTVRRVKSYYFSRKSAGAQVVAQYRVTVFLVDLQTKNFLFSVYLASF